MILQIPSVTSYALPNLLLKSSTSSSWQYPSNCTHHSVHNSILACPSSSFSVQQCPSTSLAQQNLSTSTFSFRPSTSISTFASSSSSNGLFQRQDHLTLHAHSSRTINRVQSMPANNSFLRTDYFNVRRSAEF